MFKGLELKLRNMFRLSRSPVMDTKKLYAPYVGTGKYLAITHDRSKIVASGNTPLEAQENAINAGYRDKFALERAPDTWPHPPFILATA